jgi:hypothetical protein
MDTAKESLLRPPPLHARAASDESLAMTERSDNRLYDRIAAPQSSPGLDGPQDWHRVPPPTPDPDRRAHRDLQQSVRRALGRSVWPWPFVTAAPICLLVAGITVKLQMVRVIVSRTSDWADAPE